MLYCKYTSFNFCCVQVVDWIFKLSTNFYVAPSHFSLHQSHFVMITCFGCSVGSSFNSGKTSVEVEWIPPNSAFDSTWSHSHCHVSEDTLRCSAAYRTNTVEKLPRRRRQKKIGAMKKQSNNLAIHCQSSVSQYCLSSWTTSLLGRKPRNFPCSSAFNCNLIWDLILPFPATSGRLRVMRPIFSETSAHIIIIIIIIILQSRLK